MKKFLAIFLTIILLPQPICLAIKGADDTRSVNSSLVKRRDSDGNQRTTITNRRFLYHDVYEANGDNYAQVLIEEIQREFYSPGEPVGSTVKIRAFRNGSKQQKWEFSAEGDYGETTEDFYKVTKYGCCGNLTTFRWFSLRDGRKQFTSNVDLVKVGENYFAYHNAYSAVAPDEGKLTTDLVGVIEFGGADKSHQKYLVRSRAWKQHEILPLLLKRDKRVTALNSAKGVFPVSFESLKGVFSDASEFNKEWLKMPEDSIKMVWPHESEIIIPIEKDQPRFDCATYSSGVTFEILKPDNLK